MAINCGLATGGSTERAVARYYAHDGYDGNTTVELNTRIRSDCGWSLGRATAINSAGEILGKGVKSGISGAAAYRAFLLIPTLPDPSGQFTLPATKEEGCLDAAPGDQSPTNSDPVADAGPDQRIEASSGNGGVIFLDGSGSTDPDGDPLTYSWTWSGGSASSVAPQVLLLGVTTITLTVSDGKGGTDSDDVTITVQDTTAPTIVCGNPDGNWHGQDVAIACTAQDSGGGLAHDADASFTLHTSVPAGTEDANAAPTRATCATKRETAPRQARLRGTRLTKKQPQVTCGTADGNWHAADVSIGCTAADAGSGLAGAADANFNLSTSVPTNTETANASTGSRNVCDSVGNCAKAGPISSNEVDRKPPQVSCGTADGIWHAVDVSISCTAADLGSGLANIADANFGLATTVPANTETANASTGSRNVCDSVGNCSSAGPITANKIDKKPPSIMINSPMGNYVIYQSDVTAIYSCDDAGSGPTSCSGPVANGVALLLNNAGSFDFKVTPTDAAGNTAALNKSYSVGYNVCDAEIPGSVNSGRTIPIRVKVCSANGNASSPDLVLTATSVLQISTNADAPLQDAGNANPDFNFRYTSDSVGYIFNLQTTGFPTGTFLLNFKAGAHPTTHAVTFQVR